MYGQESGPRVRIFITAQVLFSTVSPHSSGILEPIGNHQPTESLDTRETFVIVGGKNDAGHPYPGRPMGVIVSKEPL